MQAGPNYFKFLINDLNFTMNYAKYVDNTTVVAVSLNPNDQSQ